MVKDGSKEQIFAKKLAEEALDRKAKAGIQANNYNCSVRMFKNFVKKESTIKQVTCQNCGKIFKTNRDTKLCFKCEKRNDLKMSSKWFLLLIKVQNLKK